MLEAFGNRLRALRKKTGLTQEQLAEIVGVSPITISWWENDKYLPKTQSIKALAKALNVPEQDLLNDSNSTQSSGWVLSIRTANDFTEEVIDLTGNVAQIANITMTPKGVALTITADWNAWSSISEISKLFKMIKKAQPAIKDSGVSIGAISGKQ